MLGRQKQQGSAQTKKGLGNERKLFGLHGKPFPILPQEPCPGTQEHPRESSTHYCALPTDWQGASSEWSWGYEEGPMETPSLALCLLPSSHPTGWLSSWVPGHFLSTLHTSLTRLPWGLCDLLKSPQAPWLGSGFLWAGAPSAHLVVWHKLGPG